MTQIESIPLEHDFPCQTDNLGGLEQPVQEALENPAPAAPAKEKKISGFWRRLAALAIDVLILAAIGFVVGTLFYNFLARLGSHGFWVGLFISVAYFSWMNSSFNSGQTIGKRIMKIRVVDVLGNTISLGRSIKRSALLVVPFMYSSIEQAGLDLIVRIIAFFIMAAIIYLYMFNARTRQTVHDLALKTFVVHADYDLFLEEVPVPSRHFAAMTLAGVLMVALMFAWPRIIQQHDIPGTSSVLAELQKDPDVYRAAAKPVISSNSENRSRKMEIVITVKKLPAPIYMKAKQISELAMREMPAVRDMDSLSVTVNYGYNIGIAWYQKGLTYTGAPADWESNTVKIAKSAQMDISMGIGKIDL